MRASPGLWLATAALVTGCIDVPDRRGQSGDQPPADAGAPPLAADADPDPDLFRGPPPDADFDATPRDAEIDAAPDAGPDAAPDGLCPAPCPADEQLAAYAPLQRLDAVHVLPDGSVLVAGPTDDLDGLLTLLRSRALDPAHIELPVEELPAAGVGVQPMLLHLSPDLSELWTLTRLPAAATGPIVAIRAGPDGGLFLVTRHGTGRVEANGGAALDRGYAVIALRAPPSADDPDVTQRAQLVPAAGTYQEVPPAAFGPDGSAAVVLGSANPPAISEIRRLAPDGTTQVMPGWRHHVTAGAPVFGAPAGAAYSVLPLTLGDRCTLRTAIGEPGALQLYIESTPDGAGGPRFGQRPFDAFAREACPPPPVLSPPTAGGHGWGMSPGLPADVGGLALAPDGALVVGLDAQARDVDGNTDRVPAVVAYAADGALRWWQRLHPDAVELSPEVVAPVAATTDQDVVALALDTTDPDNPAVVVAARGVTADLHPLWDHPDGFQGLPRPGAAGPSTVGWIGRLSMTDGALEAATWIYRVNADPTPDRVRSGRLRCFIDETRVAAAPQPVTLARGRLAIGPAGQVAVAGFGVGLSTTPDALQPSGAPIESPSTAFVRIYDRDLSTVLYATAVGPEQADGLGINVQITDLAFTPEGHLLVTGTQVAAGGGGALPTREVPPWAQAEWPAEVQAAERSRGFVLRLVPDPECSR